MSPILAFPAMIFLCFPIFRTLFSGSDYSMALSIKSWLVPFIERLGMASESKTPFHYIMFVNI